MKFLIASASLAYVANAACPNACSRKGKCYRPEFPGNSFTGFFPGNSWREVFEIQMDVYCC